MKTLSVTCSEFRAQARESLSGYWNEAAIVGLIYLAISAVSGCIPCLNFIISIMVMWPLGYGFNIYFLRYTRNEDVEATNIFDGFKKYTEILLTLLLMNVYILLWCFLLIVPGIVKCYSYAMTSYIMHDEGLYYNDAIEKSMDMMMGNKWKLFVLDLTFIGWGFLCVLTCGIGFIWLSPYISTTRAKFYEALKASYELENAY